MKKAKGWVVSVLGILCFLPSVFMKHGAALASDSTSIFRRGRQSIGIAAGHGVALPVGGSASGELRDVQFLYFAPRWSVGLSDPMGAGTWYRGNFELVLEGTFLYGFEPRSGIAGGFTPLFRYNFLAGDRWVPFIQAGAGVLALDFDVRRQADGINFTPQAGVGLHYFLSERTALTGEWRYLHISNASIHRNNSGINSSVVLVGLTVFLRK
jgi:lipid A 3-O-deacylase